MSTMILTEGEEGKEGAFISFDANALRAIVRTGNNENLMVFEGGAGISVRGFVDGARGVSKVSELVTTENPLVLRGLKRAVLEEVRDGLDAAVIENFVCKDNNPDKLVGTGRSFDSATLTIRY